MKKINITLTKTEERALEAIMFSANPCEGVCVFEEVSKNEKIDCPNCPYTKAYFSLIEKFGILIGVFDDSEEEN